MKGNDKIKKLSRCGLMAAIACVLTLFPQVPTGTGGYVHFGDSIIYIAAAFMGPLCGAAVGAIGHAMADLLSGYAVFVPATFIIKGIMGYTIGRILYRNFTGVRFVAAAVTALFIVVFGYFIAEIFIFDLRTALIVFISSPIQWLMSVAASAVLLPLFSKIKGKLKI